jgi:hypothetical protein
MVHGAECMKQRKGIGEQGIERKLPSASVDGIKM